MKGRKPHVSRFKRAFLAATAIFGIGVGTATLDNLPKDPVTDTQIVSTMNRGEWSQSGVNISPSDQLWKQTINMRSDESRAADLMAAAYSGDSWRVNALLENGVNPRSAVANDALDAAAWAGHADVVTAMMRNGVDPTANDGSALVSAIRGGNDNIAHYLMELGVRGDAQNNEGLLIAAFRGDETMVQSLLYNGANPSAHDKAALTYAQVFGYSDLATRLQTAIDAQQIAAATADNPFSAWNYGGPAFNPGPFGP